MPQLQFPGVLEPAVSKMKKDLFQLSFFRDMRYEIYIYRYIDMLVFFFEDIMDIIWIFGY